MNKVGHTLWIILPTIFFKQIIHQTKNKIIHMKKILLETNKYTQKIKH